MLVLKGLQGKAFVLIDLQENTKSISFVLDETSSVPFEDYLLNYKTVSEAIQTIQKILEEKNKFYDYILFYTNFPEQETKELKELLEKLEKTQCQVGILMCKE